MTTRRLGDIEIQRIIEFHAPMAAPIDFFDDATPDAVATRKSFLEAHCETDTLVLTAHFPSPSVGRVVRHAERAFDFSYA